LQKWGVRPKKKVKSYLVILGSWQYKRGRGRGREQERVKAMEAARREQRMEE